MISFETFDKKLTEHYQQFDKHDSLVRDGIIDVDRFARAKYKILWILKEPYGDGRFSYPAYIHDFRFGQGYPTSGSMWHKITYTNYGILNKFMQWSEIPALKVDENVFNTLKACAIINLKKLPGGIISYYGEIKEAYEKSKGIINEQINLISPDIIICGGTFGFISSDLGIKNPFGSEADFGFLMRNKLIVNAYHPSYYFKRQEKYCNEIIALCREF